MQLSSFKIFCDLVETASFSRAAEANDVTQSAVSQQIRGLEDRLGVTLVERGRRHFAVTPEGEVFLDASRAILDIYNHLGDRLHELRDVVAGDVKIASIFSVGLHELPPYLKKFRAEYPDVEVQVEYRRSQQVYDEVLAGTVDLGLVAYPQRRQGLVEETFCRDRLVIICPPAHRLAGRESAPLAELKGERFISFESDQPTRRMIDRQFRERDVNVVQAMEFDNVETVKRSVIIEEGVSVVPENTVRDEVRSGMLSAVPIVEPEMWRPVSILTKRNRTRSPAQKAFITLLRATVTDDNADPVCGDGSLVAGRNGNESEEFES